MINEAMIVEDLLNGKIINPYQMRYYCTLLVRFCIGKGMSDDEIYDFIFSWANKNGYYIKLYLSVIVKRCRENYVELNRSPIYLSNRELNYVKNNIKSKVSKRLAIAIILYAKFTKQTGDIVEIPVATISDWIGCKNKSNVYNIYLKNLSDIGFLVDCDVKNKWKGKSIYSIKDKMKKIKINLLLDFDTKDIEFSSNNINELLEEK